MSGRACGPGCTTEKTMVSMNKSMAEQIADIDWQSETLPPDLAEIVAAGFDESEEGVFLAAFQKHATTGQRKHFPDRSAYECFVNSFHVEDYADSDCLIYACLFLEKIFERWRAENRVGQIEGIISVDEDDDAVVRIHLLRTDEPCVRPDLEGYKEAMLVADSSTTTLK